LARASYHPRILSLIAAGAIMKLTVHKMDNADIFSDRARLHYSYRPGIKSGTICAIRANNKVTYVEVRNTPRATGIQLDDETRSRLDLKDGCEYEFEPLEIVGFLRELIWFSRASNPINRVAGKMGVLSIGLGGLSLLLAMPPFLDWLFKL
jgi:hypothetical protein